MNPECTCPIDTCNDPPCPVHGFPKCKQCGEDEHDYVSCEAVRNIKERHERARTTSAKPGP